jgi:pimeloyl-ACP methyl ester carboxylesterase
LHYHTFAIDLCGHGDSAWDRGGDYNIRAHVADVISVVRTFAWKNIALVGHSMGADIAIRVAIECPECVLGLVLVDFGPVLNSEGLLRVHEDFRAGDRLYRSISEYVTWVAERRPLAQAELLERIAPCALRYRPDGTFQRKADPAMIRYKTDRHDCDRGASELWAYLTHLHRPVLVVRGEGSAVLTRETAKQMTKVLYNGHLRTVRLAGHDVMNDNPAGFLEAVLPFLRALQAPT